MRLFLLGLSRVTIGIFILAQIRWKLSFFENDSASASLGGAEDVVFDDFARVSVSHVFLGDFE